MNRESTYLRDGQGYYRTAVGAKKRPQIFTPEIVYNLLSMVIEKYFMAFFESHHTMADNHTFTDLINSANRIAPVPSTLINDLKSLEVFQNLCPVFTGYQRSIPDEGQIRKMYEVTDRVIEYCVRN